MNSKISTQEEANLKGERQETVISFVKVSDPELRSTTFEGNNFAKPSIVPPELVEITQPCKH